MTDYRQIGNDDSQWARLLREGGRYVNYADWLYQSQTALGQRVCAEPTTQFAFKSVFPLSTQRDELTETNGGTVTHQNGAEYRVRATATAGSVAQIMTKQIGDYLPEHVFLPSLGLRIPTQPTGDAKILFGYFNYDSGVTNGTYLEYNASGLFHKVVSGGTEVYSQQITDVDAASGHIYHLPFLFYGYGFAGVDVPAVTDGALQVERKSTYYPDGELLFENSNLPLTCRVEGDGTQLDAYVAGRQMSVIGKNDRMFRAVNAVRKQQGIADASSYVPMVSVQNKTAFKEIFAQIREVTAIADADMEIAIILNGSLTGASFGTPEDYTASEVATEWDTSATDISGGEKIYGGLIEGNNKTALTQAGLPEMPLLNGDTWSFCLRLISGTNGTATLNAEMKENW